MRNKNTLNFDATALYGKMPPQANEVENKLIGYMLLNAHCISKVTELISESDFYKEENKILFSAIVHVSKTTTPDFTLVAQHLMDIGKLDEVGGAYNIVKKTDQITGDLNIIPYCFKIKEKSAKRRLIELGSYIFSTSFEDNGSDVFDLLTEAENKLKGINTEINSLGNISLAKIGMNVIEHFDDMVYKAKNNIVNENEIFTGIGEWDKMNGALFPGLYVIAGRPGMGKGVHMTELICRMAKNHNIGVVNGEMTDEQLLKRIGCNLMGIDNFLFKKNPYYVTEKEQELLKEAMNEAINLKLFIENNRNINKIANKIRSWVLNNGVKCVLADFLTIFKVPPELEKYYTKTQQVDYILDVFVGLCKELNVPIILYVQMNREILGRHGIKEPNLGDLKASGSIEELAYQVSFLHRPEYYDDKSAQDEFGEDLKGLMYQIIAKHRDGELGKLKYKAILPCSQIKDWVEAKLLKIDKDEDMPF